MTRILCWLGFHDWENWYLGTTAAAAGPAGQEVYHAERTCKRCGKTENL